MSYLMAFVVALSLSDAPAPLAHGAKAGVVAPAHPNFITPGPFVPYLYPYVPAPVVITHPTWYRYPGPAWWYANNISPYHPVHHDVTPKKKEKEKKDKKGR
jgi:hypothetical protein